MSAGQGSCASDQRDQVEPLAVDGHRHALLELDLDHLRRGQRPLRRDGQRERLLRRLHPWILERAGLDRAAPQVVVDREGRTGLDRHLDAVLLGVGDLLLAGHAPVPHRRQHGQIGCERGHRCLEPHLVVALARAAVGDRRRATGAGDRHQVPPDQRPRQRRYQRIAALVERARLQHRQHVVGGELRTRVDHLDVGGAGVERAGSDRLGVDALPDVDQQGDHVGVVLVGQPAQGDRGVEAAGIGKNHGVFHGVSSCSRSIKRIRSCPVCGSRAISARVSSPAMVPMISGNDALSKAKATGCALAGPVFSTAM